jgi:hypothetical protein
MALLTEWIELFHMTLSFYLLFFYSSLASSQSHEREIGKGSIYIDMAQQVTSTANDGHATTSTKYTKKSTFTKKPLFYFYFLLFINAKLEEVQTGFAAHSISSRPTNNTISRSQFLSQNTGLTTRIYAKACKMLTEPVPILRSAT